MYISIDNEWKIFLFYRKTFFHSNKNALSANLLLKFMFHHFLQHNKQAIHTF